MNINFTPGPSQLYFTVESHMRQAFRDGIPSLSHRSKEFENISKEATTGLKELLGIPNDFHVFFTGSATEIWERSIQNLVVDKSLHFVNGAFSKRYFEISSQLGKHPVKIEVAAGQGFDSDFGTDNDVELIALTHNETSTGVSLPINFINQFREKFPDSLIVVDSVSSLPYPQFDYTKIDSVFFSVQKGFGLPAGLGVWVVNNRCIAKAELLLSKGVSIGTYHNLPTLLANAKKNQTPETPNVLGIYLLGKVVQDFLRRGIHSIRKETEYKAAILYQALSTHKLAKAFVQEPQFRSQTVLVANTGENTERISRHLHSHQFYPGDGYGDQKKSQLRFANFPTHSKETFERLVDLLEKLN
ncbi:MAG TPA: aminotransferase class V-fold PLP-dependent enzyme [Cyclobacteriaceae bacterium]|nr:aminotransferase class V-fold PLP-dependent enzyme [Cyclobacteriaceae bacterium]